MNALRKSLFFLGIAFFPVCASAEDGNTLGQRITLFFLLYGLGLLLTILLLIAIAKRDAAPKE